jgi:hypothetical protein
MDDSVEGAVRKRIHHIRRIAVKYGPVKRCFQRRLRRFGTGLMLGEVHKLA